MNIKDLINSLRDKESDKDETRKGSGVAISPRDKERLKEMERLRFSENWSLQEIADKYNLSRERVRQLIGNSGSGYKARRNNHSIISRPDLTNQELSEALNLSVNKISSIRGRQRHEIKGGSLKKGTDIEVIVSKLLINKGVENKLMPHKHPFDILLWNGKRVDVKSCYKKIKPKSQAGNGYYSVHIDRSRRGEYADFLIVLIVPENVYFVIPFDVATDQIRLIYPESAKKSKFSVYINRFDLLTN